MDMGGPRSVERVCMVTPNFGLFALTTYTQKDRTFSFTSSPWGGRRARLHKRIPWTPTIVRTDIDTVVYLGPTPKFKQ